MESHHYTCYLYHIEFRARPLWNIPHDQVEAHSAENNMMNISFESF